MNRRGFLKAATGVLTGLVTALLGAPLAVSLIGPQYRREQTSYARVGPVGDLPTGQPVNLSFRYESRDAYFRQTVSQDVWVIKHSPTEFTVYSPICTHLGCQVGWDSQARQFRCPCHGSVFSGDGKAMAGPAPRSMDELPYRVDRGDLYVQWQRFEPGVAQRVRI